MLTRPRTDQVLLGIVRGLEEEIAPELQTEAAQVALQMMLQLLRGCAVRAAHEISWMHDEGAAIERAVSGISDPATVQALEAYRAAPGGLDLETAASRYSLASDALSSAIEHAYAAGDAAMASTLRELLKQRSAREVEIMGALDLVGRG